MMNLDARLKEAKFVRRGNDGEYLKDVGQCGFGCDFSRLIWDEEHENVIGHVCDKLRLQGIGDYDSCKYFKNKEDIALLSKFVELSQGIDSTQKTRHPVKKKSFLERLFKGD